MENYDLYKDIASRTNGDIYIGVVGPVRTGKSTFIKRFMDLLILPNMEDVHSKGRAIDEMPQSANGKTIMTTEPKFVPNEAVRVKINDDLSFNARMIDCVGYMVNGAVGHIENEAERLVKTPWFEEEIPFTRAAEIGTDKVIKEHSTIGVVVTTDGSIATEISREGYVEAEERVIDELKRIGKPFTVLLNSVRPYAAETERLKSELEEKYSVSVIPVNCEQLKLDDVHQILKKVLYEFPMKEIHLQLPKWMETLDDTHYLKANLLDTIKNSLVYVERLRDLDDFYNSLNENEYVRKVLKDEIALDKGISTIVVQVDDTLFYQIITETTGMDIRGEYQLISLIKKLAKTKQEYDKIAYALNEVKQTGYGVVTPVVEELKLEEPEIVKQGNRFGVKLRASAPSIHLIRADIETEVSPIVGTEKQSEELVHYLMSEFEVDPKKIWESDIFGKSLHELVNEGLQNKLYRMPKDAQAKLQETLQRIINEGNGGLICIIL